MRQRFTAAYRRPHHPISPHVLSAQYPTTQRGIVLQVIIIHHPDADIDLLWAPFPDQETDPRDLRETIVGVSVLHEGIERQGDPLRR